MLSDVFDRSGRTLYVRVCVCVCVCVEHVGDAHRWRVRVGETVIVVIVWVALSRRVTFSTHSSGNEGGREGSERA